MKTIKLPVSYIITVIISVLFTASLMYYYMKPVDVIIDNTQYYEDIKIRDSIRYSKLVTEYNIIQHQKDSISKREKQRAENEKFWKEKFQHLKDSLSTLPTDTQVSLFVSNFDFGEEYTGDAIVPVQACYNANLTLLDIEEYEGIISYRDSTIEDLLALDSLNQIELKNAYFVIQQDSLDKIDFKNIIKNNEVNYNVKIKKKNNTILGLSIGNAIQLLLHIIR